MARRRAGLPRPGPAGAPYVGVVSGLALVIAAFLPWYTTNLGPPFSPSSAAGWEATNIAKLAVVMGLLVALAAAAVLLDERGALQLDARIGEGLAWLVVVAAVIAAVAVGYRLLVMPEPAQFLSRQIGLYLAAVAAVGGILSGLGLIATRD